MALLEYVVMADGARWKIRLDGIDYSPHHIQEAVESALESAHAAGKSGLDATVLVQQADGSWQAIWTYGMDLYPPVWPSSLAALI